MSNGLGVIKIIRFVEYDVMENEVFERSRTKEVTREVNLQDLNDDGHPIIFNSTPKLQFRKDFSKGRWHAELGMSEIIEKKSGMWTTTGIIRGSKLYCSIEETVFLVEIGALLLLDANDKILSLKDIYEIVAEEKHGCSWESIQAFRRLKSLGYIVRRHGIPWTLKNDRSCCKSTSSHGIQESNIVLDRGIGDHASINKLFGDMHINESSLTFDVYLPNSKFKKSSPGDPDFVLSLAGTPPSKVEIEDLERRCKGIPLKFCNVEHGLVSFFSFNSIELPVLP